MKKYNLMGINYIVDGDDIYKQVGTDAEVAKEFAKSEPKKTRKKRQPRADGSSTEIDAGFVERKKLLEQSDIDAMKEMINAEYPAGEIAQKYQVKVAYVYNLKMRMKKDGELHEQPVPPTA